MEAPRSARSACAATWTGTCGWSDARDKEIEAEIDAELRAAVAVAEKTPPPSLDSMFEDVFAEPPWHLVEQREALLRGPRARRTEERALEFPPG